MSQASCIHVGYESSTHSAGSMPVSSPALAGQPSPSRSANALTAIAAEARRAARSDRGDVAAVSGEWEFPKHSHLAQFEDSF